MFESVADGTARGRTPSKFDDQLGIAADQAIPTVSAALLYPFEHIRQQGGGEEGIKNQRVGELSDHGGWLCAENGVERVNGDDGQHKSCEICGSLGYATTPPSGGGSAGGEMKQWRATGHIGDTTLGKPP